MEKIFVNLGEYKTGKSPCILTAYSLGSCLGIVLYDPIERVGGLAHAMLPDSSVKPDKIITGKYVDSSIKSMLDNIILRGAKKARIIAKIAGGAHMFSGAGISDIVKVGEKNILMAENTFTELHIPITASDCGGEFGRTVEFNLDTGKLKIKSVAHGEKEI